jgi:hypothetical protein
MGDMGGTCNSRAVGEPAIVCDGIVEMAGA